MSKAKEKLIPLPEDLQDLSQLVVEPVLAIDPAATEKETAALMAKLSLLPPQKYEQIMICGFKRPLSNDEIRSHPLVRLLHDFKHLMYHGNRGNREEREEKEKVKGRAFENYLCRISMSYYITQDPRTYDLHIKFSISTEPYPFLTRFDGTARRRMTGRELTNAVTNFLEYYVLEAEAMIAGDTTAYHFDNMVVVETDDKDQKPSAESPA